MTDRRRATRQRTLKRGTIRVGPANGIECAIPNMSEMGALLVLDSPRAVPNEFTLSTNPDGSGRQCEVVWRFTRKIGVQFT